jgi:uncharacterized alpha-E superfamily protein
MLSRVADSLYWIGRYLERAENVTRLLLVTSEISVEIEGLDDLVSQAEWDSLLLALPGGETVQRDFSPATGLVLPFLRGLLLDESNPVSVRHSLARARENARSVREALTRETFLTLNAAWRDLESAARQPLASPTEGFEAVGRVHEDILAVLGAMEHTLSRDSGWTFLKLGEALERTRRTALVLRAKLPHLDPAAAGDLPLVYARWRGLLRSVASLENFRRQHGARLDPARVVRFLLFDRHAPRSIYCGLARMKNYLAQLPQRENGEGAARILGRLLARVEYDDAQILEKPDLTPFLDEVVARLHEADAAIARQYFYT